MISIWFFIGTLLLAYGILITGSGLIDFGMVVEPRTWYPRRTFHAACVVGRAAHRARRLLLASVFSSKGN